MIQHRKQAMLLVGGLLLSGCGIQAKDVWLLKNEGARGMMSLTDAQHSLSL